MRVVVLSSGGVDSSLTLLLLRKKNYTVFPLFINYGQRAVDAEWKACQKVCEFLELKPDRMNVQGYGELVPSGITNEKCEIEKDAFLPARNLMFLTLGAAYGYAKAAHVVSISLLANPIFPDQTIDFIKDAQATISKAIGVNITILAPLISLDKADVLMLARKHNMPIEYTYYCHSGALNPCGICISCKERMAAEECLASKNL